MYSVTPYITAEIGKNNLCKSLNTDIHVNYIQKLSSFPTREQKDVMLMLHTVIICVFMDRSMLNIQMQKH
jgi:hypothetical protein